MLFYLFSPLVKRCRIYSLSQHNEHRSCNFYVTNPYGVVDKEIYIDTFQLDNTDAFAGGKSRCSLGVCVGRHGGHWKSPSDGFFSLESLSSSMIFFLINDLSDAVHPPSHEIDSMTTFSVQMRLDRARLP